MNGKIALDSDVAIKFLNGDKAIERLLLTRSEIFLPVIVVGELLFGALNSKHPEQNLARHMKLIRRTAVLDIKEGTASCYAKTRLTLKKKGTPIPENDLWIAALCIENRVQLLSNDNHFTYIDNLKLESP